MGFYVLKWDILKTTTSTGVPFGKFSMGRKSHHLMERVYAHLSKNGCRKSGLLADPELTVTLFHVIMENMAASWTWRPLLSVHSQCDEIRWGWYRFSLRWNIPFKFKIELNGVIDRTFIFLLEINLKHLVHSTGQFLFMDYGN